MTIIPPLLPHHSSIFEVSLQKETKKMHALTQFVAIAALAVPAVFAQSAVWGQCGT